MNTNPELSGKTHSNYYEHKNNKHQYMISSGPPTEIFRNISKMTFIFQPWALEKE